MRIRVVILLVCSLVLSACDKGENKSSMESKVDKTPHLIQVQGGVSSSSIATSTTSNSNPKHSILNNLGIKVDSGKIIINPKQAESFLNNLGKTLEKEFNKEVQYKGQANSQGVNNPNPAVSINSDEMVIDLNKTQNLLQKWINTIRTFTQDLNRSFAPQP